MRLKTAALAAFGTFAAGCVAIYFFHGELSQVPELTYLVVGLTGIAAVVAPLLGVAMLQRWIATLE